MSVSPEATALQGPSASPTFLQARPKKSCIRGNVDQGGNVDANGAAIGKGGRGHSLSFRDEKDGFQIEASPGVSTERSPKSCLSGRADREDRVDAYGTVIRKGSKAHSLTFRDEKEGMTVEDVKEVRSYKGTMKGNFASDDEPDCSCNCSVM